MMKYIEKYNYELGNIVFLEDIERRKFRFSSILLFREYQSRLFLWKTEINSGRIGSFNKNKSFHNLFIDLSPDWIDEVITEEKVVEDLNILGFAPLYSTFRDYKGFFISMVLNWKIFKEKPEIQKYQYLPDPYEPVFKIFLRGGNIFNAEHKFEIDYQQIYREYNNNFKLPSLDEAFLSYVDSNVFTFPNQELVNELWEKFQKLP